SINFDIRRRVDTRGDLGSTESRWARGAGHVGILREDVVDLNLDIPDIVQGRSHRYQPENRGSRDDCSLLQEEIIGCFGLDLSSARAAGECAEQPVRATCGEEKWSCPEGRREARS